MKELGQYLKSQREGKNITLEEVSVATKIGIKVLTAIEEGEVERLPPKPFVRGFVQAYARYLELDVKEVLEMYQKATGTVPPPPALAIPEHTKKIERGLPGGARNIITIGLIILLIIAIVVVQRMISKREAEMHGEVSAITGNAEPLNIVPSPTPTAESSPGSLSAQTAITAGAASPLPAQEALPKPTPTPKLELKPTPTPKVEQKPEPTATPTPTPTPKPEPSPTATPKPKPSPSPEPSPTATPEMIPQEVIVEALDKVTIKVTIDSKAEQEVTLNPDQIQTFKAKGKIKIYTPDGGAISVIQNGFDLGVPGNLGQPKTMVFPK